MSYSATLIETLKQTKGFAKDAEVVAVLPKMTKGNLSSVKSGQRHLTEEQALWIAQQCQLDAGLVLVELAAECAKTETAQTVWHNLAKKLKATTKAVVVALILLITHTSGHYPPQRIKNIP